MIAERVRIAGVSRAEGYPRNLLDLVERIDHDEAVRAELVRDLDNAHDLNATAVRVEGRHLGHLPADVAATWAPIIDAGELVQVWLVRVAVNLDHRDKPGLDVLVAGGPELDADSAALLWRYGAGAGSVFPDDGPDW